MCDRKWIPSLEDRLRRSRKSDREIEYAIRQGIFAFNCESLQELEVINELAGRLGKQVNVALRINPDVRPHTHHYISTGQSESKFGISYAEIDAALAELHAMKNIRIFGLHFHIGSQIRELESFAELAGKVNGIAAWFTSKGVELRHLNMGGGLGIDYNDPDGEPIPDFVGYFRTFHENLRLTPGQTVHFELGRSIVAQCGELITRVLYTKTTAGGAHFVITDAGMTELIRPALYSARHKIENLTAAAERRPIGLCSIAGPICESSDILPAISNSLNHTAAISSRSAPQELTAASWLRTTICGPQPPADSATEQYGDNPISQNCKIPIIRALNQLPPNEQFFKFSPKLRPDFVYNEEVVLRTTSSPNIYIKNLTGSIRPATGWKSGYLH